MTPRRLMLVWLLVVGLLGAFLAVAGRAEGPLDDPDQARQRPGILDPFGRPSPAPEVEPGLPSAGRRAVVFFVRPQFSGPLCRALVQSPSLRRRADVAMISSGSAPACGQVPTVTDTEARIAAEYGMRQPRDGGAPVGYALVDRNGLVRYRTLDPSVVSGLREVETMVKATP